MEELLNIARSAANEAAQEIMTIYAGTFTSRNKKDGTPVTEADERAHTIIHNVLHTTNIPVLSEEDEDSKERLHSSRVWIVDPLDGTRDFIEHTDEFAVMIGLVEKGAPLLGVVVLPAWGYELYAYRGGGAWRAPFNKSPERIHVSSKTNIEEATLAISRSHFTSTTQSVIKKLKPGEQYKVGSNGIKIGLVAEGKVDAFFNPTDKMGEWDSAGPHCILEEAGGTLTGMRGEPLVYNKVEPKLPDGICATNGYLHDTISHIYT